MDTRNSREVTNALPDSWEGIEYVMGIKLMEGRGSGPSELSLTGRKPTAEAVISISFTSATSLSVSVIFHKSNRPILCYSQVGRSTSLPQ
ncbi:hypothetical protein EVAR_102180_1 [Eumeta japonica]|uniref:Uncharacterized protein n=1 Tax=Eumeta variegata TaxID=151549 RepID=A0A4C1ZFF4_EUMVA|nr:hypothetical protein EVAR_102180_1 [Eumeta japonica]